MKKKLIAAVLFLLTLPLILTTCGKDSDSPKSPPSSPPKSSSPAPEAKRQTEEQPLALRIKYGYDGQFGFLGIADTATAYIGPTFLAKAKALKIIKKDPGPHHILVEEFHFSPEGQQVYHGTLEFRFGFGGGTLVEEKAMSGKKRFQVFTGWPAGH